MVVGSVGTLGTVGTWLLDSLERELSGDRALACAAEIARYHRAKGSSDYSRAVTFVANAMRAWGLEDVTVDTFPADGRTAYETWTPPPAWEPSGAELRLVKPQARLICSFESEPLCLIFGSTSTPPEGLEFEIVDVGDGKAADAYSRCSVAGKVVITSGDARTAFERAVRERGALGVLTDYMSNQVPEIGRTPRDLPDAVNYASFPVNSEDIGRTAFGFSLSHRQAEELRGLLRAGRPVRARATVRARLFAGRLEVLTALVRGEEQGRGEVAILAHLCHPRPGANDNASGCGLAMEIARAVAAAVSSGRMPRPRLGLRFMFVPEMYGTMAFLSSHPDWPRVVRAGINLDMVGESRETMARANLVGTPWSLPSALTDLAASYMKTVACQGRMHEGGEPVSSWHYNVTGFTGGSDHYILVDSSYGIPCVSLGHWPDRFYHSNMDTPERLDPRELQRMGLVAASTALSIANLDATSAAFVLNVADAAARTRLVEAAAAACEAALACPDPAKKAEAARMFVERARIVADRDIAAMDWVVRVVPDGDAPRVRAIARALRRGLRGAFRAACAKVSVFAGHVEATRGPRAAGRADAYSDAGAHVGRVYSRTFKGPLDPSRLRSIQERIGGGRRAEFEARREEDPDLGLRLAEILNYMDGRRSLGEIAALVSAEYPGLAWNDLEGFVSDLESAGLVRLE